MVKRQLLIAILVLMMLPVKGQVAFGDAELLNRDWKFQLGDPQEAAAPDFDDSRWRSLNLPHDWSVEGTYSPHHASATGYLPGGIGWYRKQIDIPTSQANQKIYLYLEGVYRNGEVFINGHSLGMRPNGYISYMHDLTPHLNFGGKNTIAVRVDHSESADSRWYTGSGIYRDVYLVTAHPIHIDQWGIHFTTPKVTSRKAEVQVATSLTNHSGTPTPLTVTQELRDKNQIQVASTSSRLSLEGGEQGSVTQKMDLSNPHLWSLDTPYLYTLVTKVYANNEVIDQSDIKVGVRTLDFDPDKGFALNGVSMNLKGVCLHHDAGSLGAAVPREVWKRRLLALKELGTNAIRTSHNPQAPDLYELCDELGLLVLNEAFDEWEYPKKKWIEGWNQGEPGFQGHAAFFEEWAATDLKDMILRDRNHPSIIMWSIGNEVDYPNDPYSHPVLDQEGIGQQHVRGYQPDQPHADRLGAIAERFAAIVRKYDPTRPVTAGLAGPVMSNETDYPGALDVVGYNYTENRYESDHKKYPDRIFYGSENRHGLSEWKHVRDKDYIFGQFLWTGIDYLGEAHRWPSRGFTSGLLDLAGYKKPRAYFRQSLWSNEPMVYLGTYPNGRGRNHLSSDADPVWNYQEDQTIRVVSYTNCETVQLLLNGEKIGEPVAQNDETGIIHWDLPFEGGTLEAIGYTNGRETARYQIQTSGRPESISAQIWDNKQAIDKDFGVAQIEVEILDAEGKHVVLADNEISVRVRGPFSLLGMEASNPQDMGNYKNNRLRAFNGRMIVYIQANGEAGEGTIELTAPWLKGATVTIQSE
ncbi:sugar-binding domain-containing protein [Geofilum rubicundum]|uniref:Beta-galactosidase n=1 Tax=Geofilum rubicundum JCM 15548 TaxID=1236989 RepID=A0A0E9LZV9_9BACT|nr:sugar-binding domain-containing protein [Geofilum rubicundum]GAO30666.1 beta-galactosidase [Geofilum rubicundum JCM 15548]